MLMEINNVQRNDLPNGGSPLENLQEKLTKVLITSGIVTTSPIMDRI